MQPSPGLLLWLPVAKYVAKVLLLSVATLPGPLARLQPQTCSCAGTGLQIVSMQPRSTLPGSPGAPVEPFLGVFYRKVQKRPPALRSSIVDMIAELAQEDRRAYPYLILALSDADRGV